MIDRIIERHRLAHEPTIVHKKMLAVVVADVEIDGDFHFDRQKVGTTPADPSRARAP